jgi:aerobic carbon-monoxide dehydrogenase medium subunit
MYPRPIERFFAPTTITEALRLLGEYRGNAKLIAGGQSLMPMLKVRLLETQCLIDLNRVQGLAEIREDGDGLCLGPMVRHADVETNPFIRASYPILADAARVIGDPQIRNRGTIGGSLVHADPAADYPAVVLALDARLTLTKSSAESRTVQASEFFLSPMITAISDDELLTAIRLPKPAARSAGAYVKHSLVSGDFAIISVAAQLALDKGGRCERARIVIGATASGATPAVRASELLAGNKLDETLCRKAGEAAAREVEVSSDVRASAQYRRELIKSLVPTMIRRAQERAGGR